jgi:catechol-2,3-dioxygenase
MAVRRLNHAVLYVRDLASTVDFYRATLGFEVRTEIPGRAAFLRAPGSANDHDLGLFEVGASDHRVSKSLYAKDPNGIEFEVMWRVPAEDWEQELQGGGMIAPLDLDGELARWGDRTTGAAAGSVT